MTSETAKWLLLPCILTWVAPNNSFNFSQPYFGVFFSTHVFPAGHRGYWSNGILDMVHQVATTVSIIKSPWILVSHENRSHTFIPINIAKFNKANPSRPLTLFLTFSPSSETNKNNLTSFDLVMERAEMANSISRGTAKILICDSIGTRNLLTGLESARRVLDRNKTESEYVLGARIPLNYCEDSPLLKKYVKPILRLKLGMVIFEVFTDFDYKNFRVIETVVWIRERFMNCKREVNNFSPVTEVAFLAAFPDTDREGRQNFSNFVTFWEKLNDWAELTKTKVFMFEAFDNPKRKFPGNTRGWWRVARSLKSSSDYVFQSKREAMLEHGRATKPPEVVVGGHGMGIRNILVIVVVSSILLLAMFIGGISFLFRRVIQAIEKRQRQPISEGDIQEFFHGSDTEPGVLERWNVFGYDVEKYELSAEHFIVDEGSPLGSGNFGAVFQADVNMDGEEITVAVKTVRRRSRACNRATKGLLSEIKVMGYLGHHENLVKMIGAHTSELQKGIIYLFLELCPVGSLEGYLRRLSSATEMSSYRELLELDEKDDCEVNVRDPLSPAILYRWAHEIASGMAFVASKHVVHADLATRNLLLCSALTVKIADFGLSRRMYNYASYVKTGKEELPWRWMSPEALRRMEFNEKSDVWAYGITLWEIYSHGAIPYPGLCWSNDFFTKLEAGLRMEEPKYNANEMYSRMLSCWDVNPARRPVFFKLKESLETAIH